MILFINLVIDSLHQDPVEMHIDPRFFLPNILVCEMLRENIVDIVYGEYIGDIKHMTIIN